jgi:hypothetical protein
MEHGMAYTPLDRRSFVALSTLVGISCAVAPCIAFADDASLPSSTNEGTSAQLDQLPDNPTLEELQSFADTELADMPDPEGMIVSSKTVENVSDFGVELSD